MTFKYYNVFGIVTAFFKQLVSTGGGVIVFNATSNNISFISWWSVLLDEETGESEKTTDLSQVTDELYHIMLYGVHIAIAGFELAALAVNPTTIRSRPRRHRFLLV
jgi:hypothetical protein